MALNGRVSRDSIGRATMIWMGSERSVIDLAVVPNTVSADMSVFDVWEGVHVHRALAVWV